MIAAAAAAFGIVHDYGYLHASILTGSREGWYYALATHVADRARREHGSLLAVTTAGSVENVSRLAAGRGHCREMFALIQDGIPVPADAGLELLGRLPEPETLLLLGRSDHAIHTFSDLRGASIGIGPEGSGPANLMHQLFEDPDLRELDVHMSFHELPEQAMLVAQKRLDLAAFVMQEDAPFLRNIIRKHDLDIVAPALQFFRTGQPELADRYFPWLVNLMSPVYWVYLVMAVTILFNVLKALSRFRLWRIDSAREKLETALKTLVDRGLTHAQMRSARADGVVAPEQRAVARSIMEQLTALRARCQRQVGSIVTPMGDEMFYRYQQALIDEAITTLGTILSSCSHTETLPR